MNMLKTKLLVMLVLTISLSFSTFAADDDFGDFAIEKKFTKEPVQETERASRGSGSRRTEVADADEDKAYHGLLAQLVVLQTGLSRYLPINPTDQQCFEMLAQNEIVPEGGWNPEEVVTRGDLIRVMVQSLDREMEVEDPDNPASWAETLAAMGIEVTTIGETIREVKIRTLQTPVDPFVFELRGVDLTRILLNVSPQVVADPVTPN